MDFQKLSKGKKNLFILATSVVFAVTVGVFTWLQYVVPYMMDDDWYQTLLYSDEKIKNIFDIFKAQKWHYMNWGGRSVAHTILQAVLLLPEHVTDVLNVLMLILTGIIVTHMAEKMTLTKMSRAGRFLSVTVVCGLTLGLNEDVFYSMVWQSGACNYLYMTNIILLFLWVYVRRLPFDCLKPEEEPWGIYVWIIPLSLMAGWSNENMGPAAFIFALISVIFLKKTDRKITGWMVEGVAGSLIGTCACILAPGNFVREDTVSEHGIIWTIYLRCYYLFNGFFRYLGIAVLACIAVYIVARLILHTRVGIEPGLFILSAALSWGAFVLSPHYPSRSAYGTIVLLIVAIMAMALKVIKKVPAAFRFFMIGGFFIWLRGMFFVAERIGFQLEWIV